MSNHYVIHFKLIQCYMSIIIYNKEGLCKLTIPLLQRWVYPKQRQSSLNSNHQGPQATPPLSRPWLGISSHTLTLVPGQGTSGHTLTSVPGWGTSGCAPYPAGLDGGSQTAPSPSSRPGDLRPHSLPQGSWQQTSRYTSHLSAGLGNLRLLPPPWCQVGEPQAASPA